MRPSNDSFTPLLVGFTKTAKLLDMSRPHLHELERSGKIGPIPNRTLDSRPKFDYQELRDWKNAGCPPREKWQKIKKDIDNSQN